MSRLLRAGADVSAKDNEGNTLLHDVTSRCIRSVYSTSNVTRKGILAQLLQVGANVTAKNNAGMMPLDLIRKELLQTTTTIASMKSKYQKAAMKEILKYKIENYEQIERLLKAGAALTAPDEVHPLLHLCSCFFRVHLSKDEMNELPIPNCIKANVLKKLY